MNKTKRCSISDSLVSALNNPQFKAAQCYKNAFILCMDMSCSKEIVRGAIGYVLSNNGKRFVAVRHAWVERLNRTTGRYDDVIDPTVFVDGYNPVSVLNFEYLPVETISAERWLEKTENNDYCPDLWNLAGEDAVVAELREKGYEVLS